MPDSVSSARPVVAIIPIGSLVGAKSRLGAVLDAEERLELTLRLARTTIGAAVASDGIDETLVVTPDDEVRRLAETLGARPLRQRDGGLNRGVDAGRAEALAAGAAAVLILPIDLPEVSTAAIDADPRDAFGEPRRPLVAIVADRHGRGTNALLLAPPDAIDTCFGGDSRAAHVRAAVEAGATLVELDGPLALDLDTPDDLLLAEAEPANRRCPLTQAASRRSPSTGSPRSWRATTSAALIGDAIERTAGLLPLRPDDVLVVTQKIVSKAEGAIVDLTTIEPRPEAVAFARAVGPRPAPDRGRPARGAPGRPDGARRPDHRDAARLRLRERRRRRLERRAGQRLHRDAPATRPGRVGAGDPRGRPRAVRHGRPRHRLGLVRPAVALGHHGRRDRRLRPPADRGPPRPGRCRRAGDEVDDPGLRRRDRVGGGARPREGRPAAGRDRPRREARCSARDRSPTA